MLLLARVYLPFSRIWHRSVQSSQTKSEINFPGRQIGYHRCDVRLKLRRRSLRGCECADGQCTRGSFLSLFRRTRYDGCPPRSVAYSLMHRVYPFPAYLETDSTGTKRRYGKPRVSQLCEALTSQDKSRHSTKCLPRKSLLAWISWSLDVLRSERSVNYVWDFLSFLAPLEVSRAPLSDAKPKGLRNEVINAPRFSRGCKPSCFPRSFAQGWCKLLLIYLTGEFYWRLSGEVMVGDMRLSIMAWLAYKIRRLILSTTSAQVSNFCIIGLKNFWNSVILYYMHSMSNQNC